MKSLSLDCADVTPPVSTGMRSQFKSKPIRQAHGFATSGETSDWERSVSPSAPSPRRLPQPIMNQTPTPQPTTKKLSSKSFVSDFKIIMIDCLAHIVTHEYTPPDASFSLYLGDRLHIVDNGDPDWLHGFRTNDRLQQLLTFPSTCVASMQPQEQPMKLVQNVVGFYLKTSSIISSLFQHIPEAKLRLYRDQVVFAQPDSMRDNRVLVRNERGTLAYCSVAYLMLL